MHAAGGLTALTLYDNVGCGDGSGELSPAAFSRCYVPRRIRYGLDYVFLSYHEPDCHGLRPSPAAWQGVFQGLHAHYPNARLGFGGVGLNAPATPGTLRRATSIMRYYYGLRIHLPYYAGGYSWRYFAPDCVPWRTQPLWQVLRAALRTE